MSLGPLLVATAFLGGCSRPAQVEVDHLPVRRVVVYRNGVAYFERAGEVDTDEVRFRLREENVSDFLATLAVLERGSGGVHAASFPVEVDDDEAEDESLTEAMDAWAGKKKSKQQKKLRVVTLELGKGTHDLRVGYLAETPLWRPSYRLVVGKSGKATLQAWGIVLNQSGEDWRDVELALVAGAPIAFQSNLGDAVIPRRPFITDRGEVMDGVPEATTSLEVEEAYESKADADDAAEAAGPADKSIVARAMTRAANQAAPAPQAPSAGSGFGMGEMEDFGAVTDRSRLSKVTQQTGSTRYAVPTKVTIPNESATMVLLISEEVAGEAVHLFAPDPMVADSSVHPFRVARFKNTSGGGLEKGPIAVFEKGAFLGQGLLDAVPSGAEVTVPFALVRGVVVRSNVKTDSRGVRLDSIENGQIKIRRDYAHVTEYEAQNGEAESVRLVVRHPRQGGAELWRPPQGTEDSSAENVALVPLTIAAHKKAKVSVEERYPILGFGDARSADVRRAISDFLASGSSGEQTQLLRAIVESSEQLERLADRRQALEREQAELERSTRETRLSIQAIEKNTQAADLRTELTGRLSRGTARLDAITKELIELDLKSSELSVRLKESVSKVKVPPPERRPR